MEKSFPNRDPGLMIDLARDQLAVQLGFVDAVDTKLGLFLGVASALAAILMGSITVQTQSLGYWGIRAVVVSVAIYLLLAAICVFGLWLRPWKAEIDTGKVYRAHYTLDDRTIGWELLNTYVSHYRQNRPSYSRKVLAGRAASMGLVAQTLILIATLALVLGRQ